jgi:ABC-type multidrug transport system ATPase subunit
MGEPFLLELEGLVVSRGTRSVLNNINFKLREGEVVALVGPNGSGKTTFIESCTGTIPFMKGSLSYYSNTNDKTVIRNKDGRNSNIPQIGLTLQNDGICGEETVEEKLLSVLNMNDEGKNADLIDSILSDWGLYHRKSNRVSQLSGGLKRRLSVLSGLCPAIFSPQPIVILLDEPSEGLDDEACNILTNWIRTISSRGSGIIFTSHDSDLINCADRIIQLEENKPIIESSGKSSGTIVTMVESEVFARQVSAKSLVNWSIKMELRNPIDTINRLTPALVTLLVSFSLIGNINYETIDTQIISLLVLLPAFITCIISPALIDRFNEADCGKWWYINLGTKFRPTSSFIGASLILPLPLTYLSWIILIGDKNELYSNDVVTWLWLPALCMLDLAIASSALHFLVSDLQRSQASSASLLLIFLVWPFLELSEALSSIMANGMSFSLELGSPLISCLFASLISSLVWLVAVFLPDA